jgi:S-DNA-T family DNA segregation ATPase FtsK/SpoIIIE
MAKKSPSPNKKTVSFGPKEPHPRPFAGLIFVIIGLLLALAIGDYSPKQTVSFFSDVQDENMIGEFGAAVAEHSRLAVGMAAYTLPLIAFWFAYGFFRGIPKVIGLRRLFFLLLLISCISVFSSIYQIEHVLEIGKNSRRMNTLVQSNEYPNGLGGAVGFSIYGKLLREFLGQVGTLVVFGVTGLFSLIVLLYDNLGGDLAKLIRQNRANRKARREEQAKLKKEKAQKEPKVRETPPPEPAQPLPTAPEPSVKPFDAVLEPASEKRPRPRIRINRETPAPKPAAQTPPVEEPLPEEEPEPLPPPPPAKKRALKLSSSTPTPPSEASGLRIIAGESVQKAAIKLPEKRGNYKFPSMNLLTEPAPPPSTEDNSTHQETAEMLVQTLEEFGVRVTPGDVHTGPVITRYDVYPAAGVRVEKIVNLDKNIALNLKALSVRILAPVPGRGCVGVEVPNKHPQAVYIRDILESEDWANTKAEIPIALGKEVSGKPLIADLTKMPHLLIAGSTGSGKTVCINAVITSLLYHSSPEDLRFVMVDPKIVEMQVYNSLPHMLVPVVTDPKKVPNALKYLLAEMEKRYLMFADIGVRNIAGYNARMAKSRKEAEEAEQRAAAMDAELTPEERAATASIEVPRDPGASEFDHQKLPYIVCIVDELADLMMVAPADIETGIARLAQLARAAGIHLILATQRPSVNVITGIIKANLPSRISFKVASKVDSRTILDTMGADQLIGKGDMLFLPPGSADLVRAQGAFVGDEEISGIVERIREINGAPVFDEQFQKNIETGENEDSGPDGEWDDELVPDAIEVIRTSKRASTSMLQRRLKIGYNRAARIMEILEAEGIVGPENGSSPREILKDLDY